MSDLAARLKSYAEFQRERPNEPMSIPDLAAEAADRLEKLEAIVTDLATVNPHHHTAVETLRRRARAAGVVATGDKGTT